MKVIYIFNALIFSSDHQKKDLPEIKNEPEIVTEHHVTKKVAPEKSLQEIETAKKRSDLMKVQMVDQKTGEAQRSVKQEKYNWLYIHLILYLPMKLHTVV